MIHARGMEPSLNRNTLIDILENRAKHDPALPLFIFLEDGELERDAVTAAALAAQAKSIAAWLDERGLSDQRILLLFPQGLAFVGAFFGCVYAGAISIPAPMPDPSRVARTLPRLQGILADAAPAAVLTNREGLGMAAEVAAHLPDLTQNLQWLAFEDCPSDLGSTWRRRSFDPNNPVHLQYTSGSTALPKGTMITHANIIANSLAIQKACRYTPESRSVVWEPYFHDDGLIQGIIQPIFTGFPCILMAPSALVARPDRWLRAISRYRATHTCGPNFAYELCRRKVTDEQRHGLDLSSLVHAQNAAEPVRAETLRKFFERFEPCGLRWNALSPNYGLAEATLMVTSGLRDTGPVIQVFDAVALEREGMIRLVSEAHPNARLLVSSGAPLAETVVAIVDPNTGERCASDRVGEILVKSPGIAAGYFRRPEESVRTFHAQVDDGDGPYLRTGDQGFLLDGDLFVTGRIKDLIIIRGENRYPQDIELSVERSHPAISPGSIAAFSIESDNEERLAVVAEIKRGSSAAPSELFIAIRGAISTEHDLRPGAIALLASGTLPKTSSGKIQRQASRKAFLEGTLQEVARWTDNTRVESSAEPTPRTSAGKSSLAIQEWLSRYLATELGMRLDEISFDISFSGYGMDSALAVRLAADLGEWLGLRLPPVIAWNYPNIRALSQHLDGTEDARRRGEARVSSGEPIAIIGAACRFPGGAEDLESFWRLLEEGTDAIGEVPPERWDIEKYYDPNPDAVGKTVSRWGGFLSRVDRFEPGFFEMAPREAAEMDPQQRILLEVSWEALEMAGQTIAGLRDSNTGVYVGISSNEYQQIGLSSTGQLDPHLFLGTTHSTGVARLSYWLGLRGANMPVNTACSSSLVAVHLACQALRDGECSMAVAGGVNLILSHEATICLSQMRALSPTGRCHSFSMDADGYVRSEGCGIVVLKRLSDAQRDGDPILAVIRGTAVNQDGRSNGLTAPHGPAQEDVIRRALANAGASPRDVGYVETHGTGTPLGDPIEVQALANVLGEGRSSNKPVVIGSVKTNIGHAESAAGIAGLLKVVLALSRGRIPRSLHFDVDRPNPHVPWEKLDVCVAAEGLPWISQGQARLAGVSAFGFSGTNAHVILEEAPPQKSANIKEASFYLLPLSAKTTEALSAMARSYQEWFSTDESSLHDIAYTASVRRSHLECRLGVAGATKGEIAAALGAFAAGEMPSSVVTGKVPQTSPQVVFIFPGQGSQWVGMGRQLFRDEPVFREALSACDGAIRKEAGFSILEELNKPSETSRLSETIVAQPALFAIEVALSTLLQSWGIVPSAVIGHSVGEIAAAHIAGLLDLEQSARLVSIRGRIMQQATGHGKMVSVVLSEDAARKTITGLEDRVGIAAVNDPASVVLSGDIDALDKIVAQLSADGVQTRNLRVNYAFHSPQMAPFVAEFVHVLGDLPVIPGTILMISTVTGKPIRAGELDAAYWGRNIRQTVRFAEAITSAVGDGHQVFVEVGPHPVLTVSTEETLAAQHAKGAVIPTLRREKDELQHALGALGALYTHGCVVDWKQLYPQGGRVVELPTYPWQRERYWIETTNRTPLATRAFAGVHHSGTVHPLLGMPFFSSTQPDARFWQQTISIATLPWLGEHRVQGDIVFPGAGYVELALAAGAVSFGDNHLLLEDVAFQQMLALGAEDAVDVQVVLTPDGARSSFQIASQGEKANAWTIHARGFLRLTEDKPQQVIDAPKNIATRLANFLDVASFYQGIRNRHIEHGPTFQGIIELYGGGKEVLAKIRLPKDADDKGYLFHPALLDACFQAAIGSLTAASDTNTYVPVGIERLRLYARPSREIWVLVTKREENDATLCDCRILNENGHVFADVEGLRSLKLTLGVSGKRDALENCVYDISWRSAEALPEPKLPNRGTWVVFADRNGMSDALNAQLSALGQRCIRVVAGSSYQRIKPDLVQIDSRAAGDYQRVFREVIGDDGRCNGVVHLASLDAAPFEQTTTETLAADLSKASVTATYLAQAIVRHGFRDAPRLFLITRGAQSVNSTDHVSVAQAPILGFGKAIAIEHPELVCTRIDLSPAASDQDAHLLLREFASKTREDQIALRGDRRHLARLVQNGFEREEKEEEGSPLELACGRPFRLEIRKPGVLENLALHEMDMPTPGPGELVINVEAAGLNFRDVLMALGVLPDDAPGADQYGPRLGGECAGTIVAVGEGSSEFVPGQSVVAFASRAFGSFMVARIDACALKPEQLSWAEAAVLPVVFMTAYYALDHVGRLRKGERVLIHAGAGGVGLAAIQWAQYVGAEIFATAGSEEKRTYLRKIGVQHVLDSRSLGFADEIKRITHGEGVDVVLNSLSGEFIPASLGVLRDWGRFIEIGMRDYYENKPLDTRPFLHNLSFSLLDLRKLMMQRPERAGTLLRELLTMFANGILKPLPVQTFPISLAAQAFQYMAQAKHIGKIALVMKDADAQIEGVGKKVAITIRNDRTYLITGGLGGLGLSLAHWFVEQGARSLVLVGRKVPNDEAAIVIRVMEQAGARVRSMQADVSRENDVVNLFTAIRVDMPPLGGIVHAAAVLDDHTLLEQSEDSFQNVFAPKALGAWNLHVHSDADSLDFFVMYSSVASLMGSPGQANYCASNAFLDALAHERMRHGLPAMSIQWGGFADIGLAAANELRGKRLSYRGIASFSPAEGLEALRRLFEHPRPVVSVVRFDARQWVEFYPNTASVPFFAEVMKQDLGRDKGGQQAKQMLVQLQVTLPADRLPLIERHVLEQVGAVLRLDPKRIDKMTPFQNLGMDSLMNLELRNRLEATLGIRLSATLLFTYSTPGALAEHLRGALLVSDNADTEPMRNAPVDLTQEKHEEALEVGRGDIELEVNKLSAEALLDEMARELSDD